MLIALVLGSCCFHAAVHIDPLIRNRGSTLRLGCSFWLSAIQLIYLNRICLFIFVRRCIVQKIAQILLFISNPKHANLTTVREATRGSDEGCSEFPTLGDHFLALKFVLAHHLLIHDKAALREHMHDAHRTSSTRQINISRQKSCF